MSITDPNEAIIRFAETLRRTSGCVTETPLTVLRSSTDVHHIVFQHGRPALLRTDRGAPNLKLSIVHHCRPTPHPHVAGAFIVRSTYYAYEILDLEEREILTYHWHPAGKSQVRMPHLHLTSRVGPISVASAGRSPGALRLADMHIATGHVLLEDVVRLLITEFNVVALTDVWEDILIANMENFRVDRT